MRLNETQKLWLNEKVKDKDVIFMSVHGSRLYGLASETSDHDIKAIYCPSKEDLLMGRALKTYNSKNHNMNIELELKSISSFLKSALSCDTNCIDLLFTPPEHILFDSNLWNKIKYFRHDIFSQDMKGIIGYIKTHSYKYTNKIDRFDEISKLLEITLNMRDFGSTLTSDVANSSKLIDGNFKYIKNVTLVSDHEQQYLEVCGKKYIHNLSINSLIRALQHEVSRYGNRTKKGSDGGIDTKSLSHAIRVLSQLEEIINYGRVNFPLIEAPYIMNVKNGRVALEKVMTDIDERYDRCIHLLAKNKNNFPEVSNVDNMISVISKYVFGY
jgi:hypothetical protein